MADNPSTGHLNDSNLYCNATPVTASSLRLPNGHSNLSLATNGVKHTEYINESHPKAVAVVNGSSKSTTGPVLPVYKTLFSAWPRNSARTIPPSSWAADYRHLVDHVTQDVDAWFLENWPFRNDKARQAFVNAGFSRVTCLYYPLAKDDRIHFACRLLTILFLIDDQLEHMSFDEGKAYNEKLMPLARGDALPNRAVPVEYMFYDLLESMRAHHRQLADDILEPTFVFMRAQTDKTRKEITEIGHYLEYRQKDVGKA
ncbi:Aristolochene Synthase [Metarhizium guizhouense ARSEF 977]|uniref:Aristolochene Synthase n=1 Tax=Metarhizium guizhouense (strain ARSEF 977) TaxID=1276136 RepID=A0A0B4H3P8_METGA|nr:Aristolochene Synthase [Metarhizium guizhouense ARSEF 977]